MVLIDSVSRYVDGVLSEDSTKEESFSSNLLEYPQYTRPEVFNGKKSTWCTNFRKSSKNKWLEKRTIIKNNVFKKTGLVKWRRKKFGKKFIKKLERS